ncbi:energy-coupling factor ABC transporter permease [Thermodesulfovibrio thiophilus]|uniref:energy-coupling factor ABC transporter permease n=1 Tax=Thermodesulfovibrio thiophilus TaxID=340095 RepID=UPI00181017D9|nr:energy-coupling factor ABC transporter permease [Thermodesulfovibrio thiophilus]HHW19564.1 energy-coupling factor ABC transporter permease [Thermodesulfovibrio thiophilus]
MHIADGILKIEECMAWFALSLPFIGYGIKKIKDRSKVNPGYKALLAFLAAAVFVISCIPIPVPIAGTCSHPAGTGITAILAGPFISTVLAACALLLQALFLAHGGISTLGVNIVSMGIMGSFAGYFSFKVFKKLGFKISIAGFIAGIMSDWVTYATTSFQLAFSLSGKSDFIETFFKILIAFIPTQLPIGIIEGFITSASVVIFMKKTNILDKTVAKEIKI